MKSDGELLSKSGEDPYEVTLGYLEHSGSGSDKISFPIDIRERHLTQGPTDAKLQAIGPSLQIAIWSDRDNITVRLPLKRWQTTRAYKGTMSGANNGILSVGRFADNLKTVEFPDDGSKGIAGSLWAHDFDPPCDE